MLKMSNYQSPVCDAVDLHPEGVLCVSGNQVSGPDTETFDPMTDFEW